MHPEAREFVQRQVSRLSLLEFGSRDVNGGIRDLFPCWDYLGVDRVPGRGVDVAADAATFDTPKRYDAVACCEAFEHAENWRAIVANAFRLLRPGGLFVGTAAGPGREPHNCDGSPHDGKEWYANIDPGELSEELYAVGFRDGLIEHRGKDVRWSCRKPARFRQHPRQATPAGMVGRYALSGFGGTPTRPFFRPHAGGTQEKVRRAAGLHRWRVYEVRYVHDDAGDGGRRHGCLLPAFP